MSLTGVEAGCCAHRYGLDVIRIKGSIHDALSQLKSSHPQVKAICMGTRSTDPHSGVCVCVCTCTCV